MKMSQKRVFINSILSAFYFVVGVSIFGIMAYKVYAALTTVSSGTPLSASLWNDMIGNFVWQPNGTAINYMSGNVGIGTTDPEGKLDVNGPIYGTFLLGRAGGPLSVGTKTLDGSDNSFSSIFGGGGNSHTRGSYVRVLGNEVPANSYNDYGNVIIGAGYDSSFSSYPNDRGTIRFLTNSGLTRLMISNNGNTGIGTINPKSNLDVVGRVQVTNTSNDNNRYLTFSGYSGASWDLYGGHGGGGYFAIKKDNTTAYFAIRADTGPGNVGIGTTNPAGKLSVVGHVLKQYGVRGNGVVRCNGGVTFNSTNFVCSLPYLSFAAGGDNAYHIQNSAYSRAAICYALGSGTYNGSSSVGTSAPSANYVDINTSTFDWYVAGSSGTTYITSITCTP